MRDSSCPLSTTRVSARSTSPRPGSLLVKLLLQRNVAGMNLCFQQEIGLADDVLVDELDVPAPARGTLLPDVCSSLLVFVEAYPTNTTLTKYVKTSVKLILDELRNEMIRSTDVAPKFLSFVKALGLYQMPLKIFKVMGDNTDGLDRISSLPPFIVHHIMSYLSAKDVAKTSILSKRWSYFRASFPILDFDQSDYLGTEFWDGDLDILDLEIYAESYYEQTMKFVEFVNVTLHRFYELKLRMRKFRIFISPNQVKDLSDILDRWILEAVEHRVEDLNVDVLTKKDRLYSLPQTIFYAKSVTTLKLGGFKLEQPFDSMRLPFLKSLTLHYVHINEQILQKFMSECPLLEELSLFSCWGIKYICISKPLKLKTIRIVKTLGEDHLESIKIVAPNLQKISLGFEDRQIEPHVLELSGCLQLIDLEIVGKTFSDQEFHDLISNFPLLENLTLRYCCSLEKIMISSNRLKELCIDSCVNLKAIDLVTPNLLSFTYVSNPVPTFSITASCPWRVAFNYGAADVSWYINIKEFLSASNQIDELTILDSSMRTTFNLEDFQNIPPLPPCGVECLSLYTDALPSKYAALLDSIFWICFPKFLSITSGGENRNKFIKWLCMELMNEYVYCCNSLRMKCWRHYLKGFVISSSEMKEDNEPVDIDNLLDNLSTRPSETLRFRLEWSFPTYD
ncbi:F-box/LRR-repeat protein [Citrus sinensis]|uniref:F-box/LRR-repeat protein n=2 Tax=Citrus sinensis TaxID=2711 RepID=A0ACB8JBL6_CITSI|nr:F-box/LRR-repeat protein [Citrus sinensis]